MDRGRHRARADALQLSQRDTAGFDTIRWFRLRGGETVTVHGTDDAPRVLTYSHDGYGLGHLRRNLRVIGGLVERCPGVRVLAVTGCKCAEEFSYPDGVSYLKLPAMTKAGKDRYVPDGHIAPQGAAHLRQQMITRAVTEFKPDLMLVDRYPLGLGGELRDALESIRESRTPARLVLGLRDILDDARAVRLEWARKHHAEAIDRLYDSVMVYGSQAVYDPISAYHWDAALAAKVHFTGYLTHTDTLVPRAEMRRRLAVGARTKLALCAVGGGADGAHVASAFVQAMHRLRADGWRGLLVTGPYMPDEERKRLPRSEAVEVRRFVTDLPSHLAAADAVLCMGGYNTLSEALSVNAPVVVIPRTRPRREQLIRAQAFAARGLVRVIPPDHVTAEGVAAMLLRASADDRQRRVCAFDELGCGGVERAAAHLAEMLPRKAMSSRSRMPAFGRP